jgi:serine/threonine-protein kinase
LIRRDADERLDRICAKAMMARPEERYATAAEFANDLEAWLEGRPIAWMREGVRTRTALWVRRSPRLAAVSALCVLVVLVGAFGSGFYANVARQKEADRKQLENTVSYSRSALRLLGRTMQIARIENRSPTTAEMKKLESDMRTLGRQLRDGTIPPPEPGEFDGE